ncbi:MAG TPA: hypothetical protein DCQ26_08840 [Marinilabiliales bacterium]|nr:MAG: hypothetical protein A2W95_01695 [Bacteroidetes bacterium GWA2_40_14]OFX72160.1 MAG: hypothetical protein A2W96_19495 [Bacteroidetes bacterium GWD2_40_43]OFY22172.1 MAG: hypothetical protein A2W88_05520 [Bacteroidetes bacterium GWF2_40_13]OFZ23554.1 MAG: hypothetical protein A2437_11120 [Bacteroidetes bacterium RIFOXYC2_FULL_40_12]HAM98707.1 hypothetical protein [Marinilabiliales bacterium]
MICRSKGIILICFVLFCTSCIGFRKITLKEKNPTFYVFHVPLEVLRSKIIKDFETDRTNSISDLQSIQEISKVNWFVATVNSKYSEDIFKKPENVHDLYLVLNKPVSLSKVYYKFWKPLEYSATFQLHLTSIDANRTKIEVITYNGSVFYWGIPFPGGDHAFVKEKDVQPTTIEEYEILLRIGNLIGEKDMPSLKLPKNSKY